MLFKCFQNVVWRSYATKSQFTATVLLPQTSFPLKIQDVCEHECEMQKICGFNDLYNWQQEAYKNNDPFILHDGPPYANGDVHVGHALNKILKDITNRFQLLQGRKVHYRPGWDCHGLPIEMKAIKAKELNALTASEIRKKAKTFAEKTIETQKQAFKRLGVMADWQNHENCYFTFNGSYEAIELKAFYGMYKRKLIYRDLKPVYWSPSSKTALAESELEYNDHHISRSVYVSFPLSEASTPRFQGLNGNVAALVWTTQPWTLPANQALCFASDIMYSLVRAESNSCQLDKNVYYIIAAPCIETIMKTLGVDLEIIDTFDGSLLEGVECTHPMSPDRTCRMYSAPHATTDKGTGIVHTAPAHGLEDFVVAQQHGLAAQSNVDDDGCFTDEAGFDLVGKFIFTSGNEAVLEILKQANNLVHEHDYIHSYPYDWRTKQPICVKTSRQWFIDTDQLQSRALKALEDVKTFPSTGKSTMMSQLKLRPFWCISRQRVWGLPIPVFYHKETGEVLLNDESVHHLVSIMRDHGSDVWWNWPIEKLLPESAIRKAGLHGNVQDFEPGRDILDIWFDSGISWAAVLGDGENISSTIKADLYLEGKDQYNGWFQSSLLTSVGLSDGAPYKSLLVHGFTVADGGQKMSKSLGNVMDPMVLINGGKNKAKEPAYGADALRWWAAESNVTAEVQISGRLMKDAVISVQKIRQCLRFLMSNLNGFLLEEHNLNTSSMRLIDQYFLQSLSDFLRKVTSDYQDYNYPRVCRSTLNYVTKLSNVYFHIIKDRLYCEEEKGNLRISCQIVLHHHLSALIKVIAPILPHLAEEAHMHHPTSDATSAFKDGWVSCAAIEENNNPEVTNILSTAFQIRDAFNSMIAGTQSTNYDVTIIVPEASVLKQLQTLQHEHRSNESQLCEVMMCSSCILQQDDVSSIGEHATVKKVIIEKSDDTIDCVLYIQSADLYKCPRCRRHTSPSNGHLCKRCTSVLSDPWDA